MALTQFAGLDVLRGRIHGYKRGAWWAELALDTASAPSGAGQLAAAGGLQLQGTVVPPGGVFLASSIVHVVGGAGGLSTLMTPAAFENAQIGDVLSAIMDGAGETLSPTVTSAVTAISLPFWHLAQQSAARALDLLAAAAAAVLGLEVNWRALSDGTIWIGTEAWASEQLALGADVIWQQPELGKYELGVETPAIMPGVHIADLDVDVVGVDHWLEPDRVRTWLWT